MTIGKVQDFNRQGNTFVIQTEKAQIQLKFITEKIVNIFTPIEGKKQDSKAIEELEVKNVDLTVTGELEPVISSSSLTVEIKNPFRLVFKDAQGKVINEDYEDRGICLENIGVYKKLYSGEHFYGFGEKAGFLDKRGEELEMWNSDIPEPHVPSMKALYKSIPFFVSVNQGCAYGVFFDNTYKTHFDMGKRSSKYYAFTADGGNIDYYFIYGPEIKEVVKGYTYLTGRMKLPPMWVLGYQQSRWGYFPESRVMEIANTMRAKKIPCDAIYLDIDYMDGFRVFTWDKKRFPDPHRMILKLKEMGFKVITIIDPGVKKDRYYDVYREALGKRYYVQDKDGAPYIGKVWPGDCIFPDFTDTAVREWWGNLHHRLLDVGVAGIWNDMNEPAIFTNPVENREPDEVKTMPLTNLHNNDGRIATHAEMHNVYGLLMSKATYEGLERLNNKRPFVLTRAAFAGIQKYSALWTGDNHSFWDHLSMALPMCMNLGMSGVAFVGTDVGGFSHDCTPELLSRWVQVGCFTPFFRNHAVSGCRDQEPWAFDEKTEEINRKFIQLRYKLLPYIYNLFVEASETGLPIMRPLVMEYPEDTKTYKIYDQFMFGESLLVAPVITPGTEYRHIYLPEGEWYNYFTGKKFSGKQHILYYAPLDELPLFARAGSIIPSYEPVNYVGEKEMEKLYLDIFPGNGEYVYYEDDGESMEYLKGEFNRTCFSMEEEENELVLTISQVYRGYSRGVKGYVLRVHNFNSSKVIIDQEEVFLQKDKAELVIFEVSGDKTMEIRFLKTNTRKE